MLAQLADLRLCALMSLRPYVPAHLCLRPNVPAHLCLRHYVHALMSCALLSALFCLRSSVVDRR